MNIGRLIKTKRLKQGYSQTDVAMAIGVTKQCVFQYEKESCYPSNEKLKILAEMLNISNSELKDALLSRALG